MHLLLRQSRGRRSLPALDDRGATAVEYGLMATLIAVVIVIAVTAFGSAVKGLFDLIVSSAPFT